MYATERQELIERILIDDGRVGVLDLARRFDVTTETVRRDLLTMEQGGTLRRVHGGAVALERPSTTEPSIADRSHRRSSAKQAIARRAIEAIGEGFTGSVFFDAGTTTAAVADQLPLRLAAVRGAAEVVTHSLSIAHALADVDSVSLSIVGGRIRGVTAAAVGADTVHAIETLRPDIAYVGVNGLSHAFGASTPDPEEAAVKRAVVRSARRVIVVADQTKFGRELLVSFAALSAMDVLVTDAAPTAPLASALNDVGVEVWCA
ncbi:DeoR/GlpR family DNA-binding transcription regulator [Microbacterium sp. P01]|uniref:DeoR/GlpR family DNA-binding transcription regulator n=1 Tax=unclassified Microbacterium TaxID=2609290 RepID=UPI003672E44C